MDLITGLFPGPILTNVLSLEGVAPYAATAPATYTTTVPTIIISTIVYPFVTVTVTSASTSKEYLTVYIPAVSSTSAISTFHGATRNFTQSRSSSLSLTFATITTTDTEGPTPGPSMTALFRNALIGVVTAVAATIGTVIAVYFLCRKRLRRYRDSSSTQIIPFPYVAPTPNNNLPPDAATRKANLNSGRRLLSAARTAYGRTARAVTASIYSLAGEGRIDYDDLSGRQNRLASQHHGSDMTETLIGHEASNGLR